MASSSQLLTFNNIQDIWKTEILSNIKKEIRNALQPKIEKINCLKTNLPKRLDLIESPQQFNLSVINMIPS